MAASVFTQEPQKLVRRGIGDLAIRDDHLGTMGAAWAAEAHRLQAEGHGFRAGRRHPSSRARNQPAKKDPNLDAIIRPLSDLVGGDGLEPPTLSV